MDEQRDRNGVTDRVNRLYWESEKTVDAIGEELGVSRSALYQSVRPVPSGTRCPECGEETVFTNRTNRASGNARCPGCDEALEPSRAAEGRERQRVTSGYAADEDDAVGLARWRADLREVPPERVAMIGGAAVLGVLLGAAAVHAARAAR